MRPDRGVVREPPFGLRGVCMRGDERGRGPIGALGPTTPSVREALLLFVP